MENITAKKKIVLFIVSVAVLLLGFSSNLSQAQSEDPAAAEDVELASVELSATETGLPLISMDFQDASLKDVLKILSQQANLNFIASENIKDRKVTLYLDKVTIKDALTNLMTANNLVYEQQADSRIFVVKQGAKPDIETITKIFSLQYARVKGGGVGGPSIGGDISSVIEKLVSNNGLVTQDARTNSLIVTDIPLQFPKIEDAIKKLDVKLPQVMIVVEVIEASLATIETLGIEWGSTAGEILSAYGATRTDSFPFTKFPSGSVPTITTGLISAANLKGALSMLTKDTDTKILARPKILTLHNVTAVIEISSNMVMEVTKETTYDDEGNPTDITWTPSRSNEVGRQIDPGIKLEVTPFVSSDGKITMQIEPSVSTTIASTIVENLTTEVGEYLDLDMRAAKTTVMVNNGDTVIIGGLINTQDTKVLRKVPVLGDIPLLGLLFREKDDDLLDKELVIFITPYLVGEGTKAQELAQEQQSPYGYGDLSFFKEEEMERILDRFEK